MSPPMWFVCSACGARPQSTDAFPFRCPAARPGDDIDHVIVRQLDSSALAWPTGDEPNPFVRYRALMSPYHLARAGGVSDSDYVALVRDLDAAIARVDGHGFMVTRFEPSESLASRTGLGPAGVWVKDETGNVSGSHKARHLMGVLLHLQVAEQVGLEGAGRDVRLAIASCGNAALAAAVLAGAAERPLEVFVPEVADEGIVRKLKELDAQVTVCPREPDVPGDPSYARMLQAVAGGAVPFTCQGSQNGLAIEGGLTIGWEMADRLDQDPLDHVVVQVGGGALGSALIQGLAEAASLGAASGSPTVHTVQTEGAAPLRRAFELVEARAEAQGGEAGAAIDAALQHAAAHRSEYMWPWEEEPRSVAAGILDDETYDWRALVRGMLETGGRPVVVSETELIDANRIGRETTGINVDHTGTSGLAGLARLVRERVVGEHDRTAVLFTGARRDD